MLKNWVPIMGSFENMAKNKIKFIGGITESENPITGEKIAYSKYGLLLFPEIFYNGFIETLIEFEGLSEGDEAQIVFNFNDEQNFYCIGLSNSTFKYELKAFNGRWNYEKMIGCIGDLKINKKYCLKTEIKGSIVTLYVDNVKVFTHALKISINSTNIGLWCRSKASIIIHDFNATYEKPKAFIVMQYGESYDDLYRDVIKEVCETNGYEVHRADEGTGTGIVLNDIIASIQKFAIIIADITPDNPNVFYEVGYAHALNKPTILLNEKNKRDRLPFDVSGFRAIF